MSCRRLAIWVLGVSLLLYGGTRISVRRNESRPFEVDLVLWLTLAEMGSRSVGRQFTRSCSFLEKASVCLARHRTAAALRHLRSALDAGLDCLSLGYNVAFSGNESELLLFDDLDAAIRALHGRGKKYTEKELTQLFGTIRAFTVYLAPRFQECSRLEWPLGRQLVYQDLLQ